MRSLIVLMFLVLHQSSYAQFIDGNELSKWAPAVDRVLQKVASGKDSGDYAQFIGYVQGAYDANRSFFCIQGKEFTTHQLIAITSKYLKENPQKWSLSGDKLVVLAISEAFPCPPEKTEWSKFKPLKK